MTVTPARATFISSTLMNSYRSALIILGAGNARAGKIQTSPIINYNSRPGSSLENSNANIGQLL